MIGHLEAGAILLFCLPFSTMANAQTFQQECRFDNFIQTTSQGVESGEVLWHVTMAHRNKSGRVIVDGSGDYNAKTTSFSSGAVEYKFKTDASVEIITVGSDGEALWDIRFDNGDILVYTGECNKQRRTG